MKIIHYPKYWMPYAAYTLKKKAMYGCDIEALYAKYIDAYAVDYREVVWAKSQDHIADVPEARITDVFYDWTTGLHMFELSYGNDVYRYVPVVYTGITRWAQED